MRMRSPRMAPPDTGLDGSTAMTPTVLPAPRRLAITALTSVDLPAPGGPVKPTTSACPRYGCIARSRIGAAVDSRSSSVITNAVARRSPARILCTRAAACASVSMRSRAPEVVVSAMSADRRKGEGGASVACCLVPRNHTWRRRSEPDARPAIARAHLDGSDADQRDARALGDVERWHRRHLEGVEARNASIGRRGVPQH